MAIAAARKPANLVYGVDETPPLGVVILSGLQHIGIISIALVYPLLIARAANLSVEQTSGILAATMLVLGTGAVLQSLSTGPVGARYLCPPVCTAAYLDPSLLAIRSGGLALMFGMTAFGGLLESALSRLLRRLRPYLTTEISGLVVILIAVSMCSLGFRNLLGIDALQPVDHAEYAVAAVTLATMLGLSVWNRGALRLFCALVGMALGYLLAAVTGKLTAADFQAVQSASYFSMPNFAAFNWAWDITLAIPFAVAALGNCIRGMGDITMCQKINDDNWVRPDMRSVSGGVFANGLSNVFGGVLGAHGVSTYTSSVGLAAAAGITSRRVGYAIGGIFVALAFLPKASAVFLIMPRSVVGATLLFTAAIVFVNGLQIITSRLLDARRTFVIGLSFMAGIAVDIYPGFFDGLSGPMLAIFGSSLVLGTLTALALNLVFRIGMRRTERLTMDPAQIDEVAIEAFMQTRGAAWGARRDVIERASFNLTQSVETIVDGCEPQGMVEIEATFDEFNLDIRVSYNGPPLVLPGTRPTNEEIMESEEGQRRLAGFMLRRYADRVAATHRNGRSTILFHFDH